jgi:arylamine N-acetyltransferase
MERLASDGRYTLVNNRFIVENHGGNVADDHIIGSAEEFGRILDQTFQITPLHRLPRFSRALAASCQ